MVQIPKILPGDGKKSTHPIMRSLRGEKLLVTFNKKTDSMYYETTERWWNMNTKTIRAMGYIPARGYKKDWADILTKVYVRFDNFQLNEPIRVLEDGTEINLNGYETSGTLYDYFSSKAEREFLKGMKAKSMSSMDWKQMAAIGVVAVGIILGLFMLGGH